MNERGSASALVLVLLLFLSALFASAGLFLSQAMRQAKRGEEREERRRFLALEARRILQLLMEDPTPSSDSAQDPVWTQRARRNGCTAELQDLSSRLGLNWARKELLESLDLLKPGHSLQELQQFREDTGIHLNLKPDFLQFFAEQDLDTLFTAYGYFNINVADEFALRKLHFVRSGDLASAEAFHGTIQGLRIQKKTVEPADLEKQIGWENHQLLYPVLNAEPPMNLHFVPPSILRGLFRHYRVAEEKAESILSARDSTEFAPSELETLFGKEAYAKTLLRRYLGVRTWFWRIEARCGSDALTWIVARLPGTEEPARFQVLEERFSP
jgi:hypothetical protein